MPSNISAHLRRFMAVEVGCVVSSIDGGVGEGESERPRVMGRDRGLEQDGEEEERNREREGRRWQDFEFERRCGGRGSHGQCVPDLGMLSLFPKN